MKEKEKIKKLEDFFMNVGQQIHTLVNIIKHQLKQ